jgi:predicted protein tyrosine phosphatase
MHSICIVKAHVAVNNIKLFIVAWKRKSKFHLHCFRGTDYFVVQSMIQTANYIALHIKYTILFSGFNQFFLVGGQIL